MDDENPYWLDDNFVPSSATKWDLRRRLAMYDVPVPTADVKKDVLVALWNQYIAPNRRALLEKYHATASVPPGTPIADITPARIHSVDIHDTSHAGLASSVGMFSASTAAATPTPSVSRRTNRKNPVATPAEIAPAATTSRKRGGVQSKASPVVVSDLDSSSASISSDEIEVLPPAPTVPISRRRRSIDAPQESKPQETRGFDLTTAPFRSGSRKQQQFNQATPVTSSYSGREKAQTTSRTRELGRSEYASAQAPQAHHQTLGPERTYHGSTSNRSLRESWGSQTPVAPVHDQRSRDSQWRVDQLLLSEKYNSHPNRPSLGSSSSPSSSKLMPPPLDALHHPITNFSFATMSSSAKIPIARPNQLLAGPISSKPSFAPPSAKPKPDRLDQCLGLFRAMFITALLALGSLYALAWYQIGYCTHIPEHIEDTGEIATTTTALAPPHHVKYPFYHPGAVWSLESLIPRCTPCPLHAVCARGTIIACADPENYILRPSSWLWGRGASCVPDTDKQVSIDELVQKVANEIRALSGRRICARRATDLKDTPEWIPDETIRDDLFPRVARTLAVRRSWTPDQMRNYMALAMDEMSVRPPEDFSVDPVTRAVATVRPNLGTVCWARRESTRLLIEQSWHLAVLTICALGLWVLRRRYQARLWRRAQIEAITSETLDMLMEQEQAAVAAQREQSPHPVPSYIGVAALGNMFQKRATGISEQEWRAIWQAVQKNFSRDPSVRTITAKHKGEIVECWEWVGFDALRSKTKDAVKSN